MNLKQNVTIKGTKSGLILVLNPDVNFTILKSEMVKVFSEASAFLGKNSMGLIVRGRTLSEDEEQEVLGIIEKCTELSINCVIDEESETEKLFEFTQRQSKTSVSEEEFETQEAIDFIPEGFDDNANVYVGNLRSGQDISSERSIVVLGDVKPGATVTSYGSIFILGELRGNAFAGTGGDQTAIIMALDLNPLQVRIADAIAISPDAEKGPKLKIKRKKLIANDKEPEVAYIDNGHIVKTSYGPAFLRQYHK
jgi:septum site-determining protein MinC